MEILFHCPPAEKIALGSLEEKCNIAAAVGQALLFQPCTKLEGKAPQGQQALMGVWGAVWENQTANGLNMEKPTRDF